MYYTSVTKLGDKLCHRYIKDGKRYAEIVEDFEYELFLESKYSQDSSDVYGNTLKRYTFDCVKDMSDFIRENQYTRIYGNTDPIAQFITKRYPDTIKLENDYIVLNFDIETEHAQGKIRYYDHHNILIEYVTSGAKSQIKLGDLKSIKEEVKV